MGPVAGGLVSGGLKLLGGLFGNKSAKKKEARQKQEAQAALWEQRSYDRELTNEMRNYDAAQLDKARAYDVDTPARNIRSQMAGIEEAAQTTGFNRLTLLGTANPGGGGSSIGGSSGFASGASIGSAPPLASVDLLTGALQDFGDVVTGETARRAAANKLEMDLGQLKLDQLRSGVVAFAPSATANVGDGLPALGRRAATVVPPTGSATPYRLAFSTAKSVDVPQVSSFDQYVTSSGEAVSVPKGPDLDEIASGIGIEVAGYLKSRARPYFNPDGFSLSRGFDTFGSLLGVAAPMLLPRSTARKSYKSEPYTPFSWPAGSPTFKNF